MLIGGIALHDASRRVCDVCMHAHVATCDGVIDTLLLPCSAVYADVFLQYCPEAIAISALAYALEFIGASANQGGKPFYERAVMFTARKVGVRLGWGHLIQRVQAVLDLQGAVLADLPLLICFL